MKRGQLAAVISIVFIVGVVALLGLQGNMSAQVIQVPIGTVRFNVCESPFRPPADVESRCAPSNAEKNIGKLLDNIQSCRQQLPTVLNALENARSCLTEIADDVPTYSGTECARSEPIELDESRELPEDASAYDSCSYQTAQYCEQVARVWDQVNERENYVTDHCMWPEARAAAIARDWFINPALTKDLPGWRIKQQSGQFTYASEACNRALGAENPCALRSTGGPIPIDGKTRSLPKVQMPKTQIVLPKKLIIPKIG